MSGPGGNGSGMNGPGGKKGRLHALWKSLTGKNSAQGLRIVVLLLFVIACAAIVLPVALRPRFPSILALPVALLLLASLAAKVFLVRDFYHKIALYVLDCVLLVLFNVFAGWEIDSLVRQASYSYLIYVCVLSEFYLSAPTLRDDAIMFGVNLAAYTVVYIVNAVLVGEFDRAFDLSSQYFVGLIVIVLHFIMFGFAMTLARKNRQIEENLRELEESRNELMRAYEKVEEATVIEERNRIAKEIHDTAGHSLTTVIMQTEAARLALGKDDAEAKRCIDAANLQAKSCLDGLRLSVHLLSGRRDDISFRDFLQEIIAGSSEGTGLTVRSKIDDIAMTEEAERFIANTLREGISNGVRHGGSTAFFFELRDMGSYVEFLLSDNGRGVDRKQFKEGFGLSGMRAKAEALGGMVHYAFEPGEGFEIRLSLPGALKRPAQPDREKQT